MEDIMFKSIAYGAALVASFAGMTAAASAVEPEVNREVVRFDDLNLANPAGVAILERRIASAARRVCGYDQARRNSLIVSRDISTCMTNALATARQQVAVKAGAEILKG